MRDLPVDGYIHRYTRTTICGIGDIHLVYHRCTAPRPAFHSDRDADTPLTVFQVDNLSVCTRPRFSRFVARSRLPENPFLVFALLRSSNGAKHGEGRVHVSGKLNQSHSGCNGDDIYLFFLKCSFLCSQR